MSVEDVARKYENEAQRNPEEAAASMKLLTQATQERILSQMQKDASDPNRMANMNVDRDRAGNVTAIHFTPIFGTSGTAGQTDSTVRR